MSRNAGFVTEEERVLSIWLSWAILGLTVGVDQDILNLF